MGGIPNVRIHKGKKEILRGWVLDDIMYITDSCDFGVSNMYVSRSICSMQLPKVISSQGFTGFCQRICTSAGNKRNWVIVLFIVMQYLSKIHWLFDLAWYFKC